MSETNAGLSPTAPVVGILLVNLGTPEGTDYRSVRRYLKEFLSDRRVIETPRWLWWPILNIFILSTRPRSRGKSYAAIWNKDRDESPLKTITRAQAEALSAWVAQGGLGPTRADIHVDWAMRYGQPSIGSALDRLESRGCTHLLVVPLYPQYAAATTATVADFVFSILARRRVQPALRIAAPYYDQPAYIQSLTYSLRTFIAGLDFVPDKILVSFHGMPQAYADKGDPYPLHCEATFRGLREVLGELGSKLLLTYQSRFGPGQWLKPYTDETIRMLAADRVENIVVIMPGFAADCLETLEENGIENRHLFLSDGGKNFALAPCLNDSAEGMRVIQDIVARELAGWL
jgi:ferrochelatase